MTTLMRVIVGFGRKVLTVWVVAFEVIALLGLALLVLAEFLFSPVHRRFAEGRRILWQKKRSLKE